MYSLLIEPAYPESSVFGDLYCTEPLLLYYAAACLPENTRGAVLDLQTAGQTVEECFRQKSISRAIINCPSVKADQVKSLCQTIKTISPETIILLLGQHCHIDPLYFKDTGADIIFHSGDLENLAPIIAGLELNRDLTFLETIPGNWYRNSQQICGQTSSCGPIKISPALQPVRKKEHEQANLYYLEWFDNVVSVNCTLFPCHGPLISQYHFYDQAGSSFQLRNMDHIMTELRQIKETVFLTDSLLIRDAQFLNTLFQRTAALNRDKPIMAALDRNLLLNHPGLIALAARAGVKRIMLDFEYPGPHLAQPENEQLTKSNQTIISSLQDHQISLHASFCLPAAASFDDFDRLAQYAISQTLLSPRFFIHTPQPGSPLFERACDQFITQKSGLFDGFHPVLPTAMPLRRFYRELQFLFDKTIMRANQKALHKSENRLAFNRLYQFLSKIRDAYQWYTGGASV